MPSHHHGFQLPPDWLTYIDDILTRCHDLIERQIWEGLHISRVKSWMANFDTDEQRYFAACILDSLIYRSESQTRALITQLFQRVLPDLTRNCIPPIGITADWLQILNKSTAYDPAVRLVVAVKQSDPPTKSAHFIARLMKRYMNIGEDWIINPSEVDPCITKGIKTFIFIDDFLGTGSQFESFFIEEQLECLLPKTYMVYAPLVAHCSGVQHLYNIFPNLHVRAVENLDESHSVFNSVAPCFSDGINTPDSAKEFYFRLLKTKGIDINGPERRGFGHLELAYAFSHAAPDNCLPILWWDETPTWKPLFKR